MKLAALLLSLFCSVAVAQMESAHTVFMHGNIWTVDPAKPTAEAIAVFNGRILAIGSDDEIKKYIGTHTKVIDLKGKRALPGFIDNHTHFMSGGFQLQSVDLRYAKSETEFAKLIKERAEQYPGRWITGGDWDHDNWPGGNLPTKELIDKFTPNTPVFVNRYDGHMSLANSYVLKLAGITKDTPDPPGGAIVKDPKTGEPSGVLKDEAMSFVYKHILDASDAEMLDAARLALAEARKFGLTSIQDISSAQDVRIYQMLKSKGELTARFFSRLPISQWQHLAGTGMHVPFGDEWIRLGSLKAFADGSLGSSTALFFEPFTSDPSTKGLASDIVIDGRLEKWALAADKAGLQLSIHSIGDSANSLMLDLFERIVKTNPSWDRRFRLEHAQHIAPKDFVRFAKLGVIASVQPYHAIDDGRWAEKRIGHERCKTTYPFKSFLEHGVKMCFGSDWTVAPLNPLLGIYAAVTRRTTDGANPNGWFPEQKITMQQAVEAYTINNAYAAFEEKEKGSLSVGKLADIVVLSDDIFSADPVKIEQVRVMMTVVGGKIVYEAK
ncbi:MAG: amidohydrolase [Ignavibacteriales bacterium]|nr:amidohydrolase [Ignavibacteriales bacterium]